MNFTKRSESLSYYYQHTNLFFFSIHYGYQNYRKIIFLRLKHLNILKVSVNYCHFNKRLQLIKETIYIFVNPEQIINV